MEKYGKTWKNNYICKKYTLTIHRRLFEYHQAHPTT